MNALGSEDRAPEDRSLEARSPLVIERYVVHDEFAVDMGGHVVPGRHDPAVLGLRAVPAGRDVGVGAAQGGNDRVGGGLLHGLPVLHHEEPGHEPIT